MRTIVLVLKSSKDFQLRDVQLIVRHINAKWRDGKPRIICLYDKASEHYDLGNFELLPLTNDFPGTWSRIQLYSPEMEQYRPFLYVDLDTAVINSLESLFDLVKDEFIALEDFWQKGKLATGLVWFPKNSEVIKRVWSSFKGATGKRMDVFLRTAITKCTFWQSLTNAIVDFKPNSRTLLQKLPENCDIVCFHGKPRIYEADVPWVKEYVKFNPKPKVTVVIPYKVDRGWLKDAIASVPEWVQLLVSQGEGNWPENFNKVLNQATGDYIKFLHEDDMLNAGGIEALVNAIEEQDVDFVHGNAFEIYMKHSGHIGRYAPAIKVPTLQDLLKHNVIHSATLMYRKRVFDIVGTFNESLNVMEEYEFNLRCLKAGLKIGYCNSMVAYYRRHSAQKVRVVSDEEKKAEKDMVKNMFV